MKTLGSEDAFFLYFETPDQHQHTVGTLVLDPSTAPEHCDIDTLADRLETSLASKPAFNWKLVETPFSMTAPVLVEDPAHRYDNHTHRIGLPAPGTNKQLSELVADIASTALDHRQALWECWFVSGLEGGRLAMVIKSHHCLTDAAHGAEMMADLFDSEPITPPRHDRKPAVVRHPPSLWQVTYEAMKNRRRYQTGYLDFAGRTLRSLRQRRSLFAESGKMNELVPALMESAPRLKLNGPISSRRSTALATVSLADVKAIKNALGVTVNDVIVTACTLALRQYLIATDDLPDKPLICYVPVSLILRGQRASNSDQGNQIGTMAIRLPVQLKEPEAIVNAIHDSTVAAKKVFDQSFENLFQNFVGILPPAMADRALKLYASEAVIERAPTSCNVVISNIPFSPTPVYIAGARLEATFPMGPVISGQGPNITFMSYVDRFNFSVQACREHMPDPWLLADAIISAVDQLGELAARKTAGKSLRPAVARSRSRSGSKPARAKSAAGKKVRGKPARKAKSRAS